MPMSYSQIYDLLKEGGHIAQKLPRPILDPFSKWYNTNEACVYHMGAPGYLKERYIQFKIKVQKLQDASLIKFSHPGAQPNVEVNPLPEHKK